MSKANTPTPWERRQDETSKAYEAFCVYRDMGRERSLSKVSEKLHKSETLMGRWSRTNDWVKRAALWDDEQERIEREIAQKEQAKAIREMRKRQAEYGYALQLKALNGLKRIPVDELTATDIVRMMVEGGKLERIGRGDVGEVVEERNGGDAPNPVTFYIPDNHRDQEGEEEE